MTVKYDFTAIEKKWQTRWKDEKTFACQTGDTSKPKFYVLVEFPYPSCNGLHVGHARPYTAMDVVARKKRMDGYNVMFPIGFDAFGLPTENFAIKNHIHPAKVTHDNIANFTKQLHMLGYSFDWDRVVDTTDPKYYKWTQWIFLQLYKHRLAYKTTMPVNWCTSCKCVLANEEVVEGVCERCGSPVIRKEKSQWMLKITEYAQRLIDDLDDLDFIERVKIQQKNWIGRSTGAEVTFQATTGDAIVVYTTRPDTLFGATYMVLSPEHELVRKWLEGGALKNAAEVTAYQKAAASKSDLERTELNKEKTGVRLDGVRGVNPVNGREIPIFISDYVLATYGTGAIMAVPAHDDRDWEFAKKFGCEIIEVVSGGEDVQKAAFTAKDETGILVNSDFLNGMTVKEAIPAITKWLEEKGIGHAKVNYKLRDWVFSRQRYWGEPIPMVYCEKCGWQPLPEDQLPLLLPEVESYEPTDDGESPLSKMTDWVNTTCPCCGGPAKRETDTMPQWAGSSWYFLRYMDPHNDKALASKEALEYAQKLVASLEKYVYDPVYKGYFESCKEDWTVDPWTRGVNRLPSDQKTMNTHLHMIEAYTCLLRTDKSKFMQNKVREHLYVMLNKIVDHDIHHYYYFQDRAWNPTTQEISFGHDIEGSWLMMETAEVLGEPEAMRYAQDTCMNIARACYEQGFREDGAMLSEYDPVTGHASQRLSWWEQNEAVVGFLNAWEVTGEEKYLDASLKCFDFADKHFVDHEKGGWFAVLSLDGTQVLSKQKANGPTCPYHNGRMCMEIIERCRRHAAAEGAKAE